MDHLTTDVYSPALGDWSVTDKSDKAGSVVLPAQTVLDARPARPEAERGKLAPYLQQLAAMVEGQPRAKIKDFYLALKEQGYAGSYDLVKKKIHTFRRELGRKAGLAFDSAEAPQAQVEIGKVFLKGGGLEVRAFLFTMVLGHSGRAYAELLETCEMGRFLKAHQNAFEAFGGVPKSIFYDAQESPLMRRLVGGDPFHLPVVDCGHHYGYSALPTPSFAPWMKGRLKRPSRILRKLFLTGYAFTAFEAANFEMRDWLARYVSKSGVQDRRDRAQRERLGEIPGIDFKVHGRKQFLKLRT